MNKTIWKLIIGFAVVMTFTGCGGADGAGNETETDTGPLHVFEWSGYELPEFWGQFAEQHPDTTVDFSFFGEDAEAFAKLQTGFQTDVFHPCSSWWELYVDNGLVQPLDLSRLENFGDMPESLTKYGEFNGQQYFVPWDWGYESILVRTDKVDQIPSSWNDLWDPAYAGHVAIYDSGETQHVVGSLVLGFDPYATTVEQDEAVVQKLTELKPNLLTYWTDYTEIVQLVASGDVWIAGNAWPDTLMLLREEGIPVEYITPDEGRMGYVCGFGIAANAENVDLAYDYINATTSVEAMTYLIDEYGYGAANSLALAEADQETVGLLQIADPDILNQTVFYESVTPEQREAFVSNWDRVKAAP
ncbi:MAG: extracellular solute-binding protein [Anaerolineales bacterium]|nr:extracellular solute-binding protein [Anaerolineales bacterium]